MGNQKLAKFLRCTGLTLLVLGILALLPPTAQAQVHDIFLAVTKSCPTDCVAQGATAVCTFEVENLDTQHSVDNLEVTNTFPFPSGPTTPPPGTCLQGGVPVTVLGPAGSATDSCGGSFQEVAPISCSDQTELIADEVRARALDAGPPPFTGSLTTGSTTNVIFVCPLVCDDGLECTTDSCVPGPTPGPGVGCVVQPVADSTPCGTDADPTDCTTPGCTETGECSQTHTNVAANTPCGTDTDGLTCTIPGCPGGGGTCNQTHIDNCVGEEICRTPGFWGTHGGVEKASSTNITLALLNAYNAANDPDLTICGTPITNTTECSQNSALEAICVSPKGDSLLQLGRQLTAAALNCIITSSTEPNGAICPSAGLTGGVCSGVSVEGVFSACNAACEAGNTTALVDLDNDPATPDVEVSCIGAIDCFNNGGAINETTGECNGSTDCHDRELVNGCFNFQPPGAAGSPRECNDSRKNCVTIFGNLSDCTDTCP